MASVGGGAIGNYIHLTWAGYEGTYRQTVEQRHKKGFQARTLHEKWKQARLNEEEKIKSYQSRYASMLNENELQKVETNYNKFLEIAKKIGNKQDVDEAEQNIYDELVRDMDDYLQNKYPGMVIDYCKLNATSTNYYNLEKTKGKNANSSTSTGYLKGYDNTKRDNNISNTIIQRRLDELYKAAEKMTKDNTTLGSQFKNQVDAVQRAVDELYKLSELDKKNNAKKYVKTSTLKAAPSIVLEGKDYNIISAINHLIAQARYPGSKAIGDLFETFLVVVGGKYACDRALLEANTTITDFIKKHKVGDTGGHSGTNLDTITKTLRKGLVSGISEKFLSKDGSFIMDADISQQDKIDCTLTFNGKPLNISAKNYNIGAAKNRKDGISLVSGTNLLTMLQDESPDFVNHYINLVIPHLESIKDANSYSTKEIGGYKEMNELVEKLILIKSFTGVNMSKNYDGMTLQQGTANIFAINDNQTGHIKLYSMEDMIDRALKTYTTKNHGTIKGANIEGIPPRGITQRYINPKARGFERVTAIRQRIEEIINKMHQAKISAHLSASAL